MGAPPAKMICGVPAHVDGRMIGYRRRRRRRLINRDRMWHYVEGIENWNPIWPMHGIRILPGPSSLWFDATGQRLPGRFPWLRHPGPLEHSCAVPVTTIQLVHPRPGDHQARIRAVRLRAESRSDQQELAAGGQTRDRQGAPAPVEAFKQHGAILSCATTWKNWSLA
jgi:hypothetical protein